jgi:hypothetical protein
MTMERLATEVFIARVPISNQLWMKRTTISPQLLLNG